jgi:hypothetical protein
MDELKKFFVLGLPEKEDRCPNALYIVKTGEETVKLYFTDRLKNTLEPNLSQESEEEITTDLTSNRETIEISNVGGNINLEVAQYILDAIANEVEYLQPSSTLSLGSNLVEAGTTVDRTVVSTFIQGDAGPVNRQRISRGSNIILDSFSTDSVKSVQENITVGRASVTYSSIIDHDIGPVKTNNLGRPDDTNRILRSSVSKSTSITGRLKIFYKVDDRFQTDGLQFRQTSTGSVFENVNSFSFYIGDTHTSIAIPSDINVSGIQLVTSNDEDVTTNFTDTQTTISIPDAGSNAQSYIIYNFSSGVPLEATVTITL